MKNLKKEKKALIRIRTGDVYYSKEFNEYYLVSSGCMYSDTINDFIITSLSSGESVTDQDTGMLGAVYNKSWKFILNIRFIIRLINKFLK